MSEELILERWRKLDVTVRDLPLALVLAVGSLLPSSQGHGTQVGNLPARPFDALAVVVVLMQSLPLLGRRRWPLVCLAVVSLGFFVDQVRSYHSLAGTALAVVLFSAGAHQERHRRTGAVLLSAVYVVLALWLDHLGSGEQVSGFVQFYLLLVLAWGAGTWWRFTRASEASRQRAEAALAVAAERTRIAGELHDVVTHHVTAMVVQTEAAHYLTAAPDKLTATLTEVADTGRRAISDLRHLLDLLDPEHGSRGPVRPVEVEVLVEQARRAGQPVEFTQEGTAAVSGGSAEFVTYRVVQEALTNALKHARGSATAVHVHHRPQEITVEVRTRAASATAEAVAGAVGGSGRGLAGLRERVAVLGGEFSAHRRPDGDFVVRARIPAGERS
ncbi:sensor histidine kinase [Kineococcus sp. SYSU DK002]|uniref:sensor histidine kinase n=1 Tax=Kineococcus sp. SYSU DK002 TaxID=3383123 RepID=UPI003D7DF31D